MWSSVIVRFVIIILGIMISTNVAALECYACSYLFGQSDASCLTNISAVRAINCTKKYCLTMRQEAIHNANKVISFLRDCQDKPIKVNGVETDATFRTYYRSCQQNLCNGHNGRLYNTSIGGAGGGGGNHNAIIPGKNGCLGTNAGSLWLWMLPLLLAWRLLLLGNCN